MFETGHFAALWQDMARRLDLRPEFVPGDWRHGVDPATVEQKLRGDAQHEIRAVCVVHNETSTGVTSRIPEIRAAIDRARHPALFLVDTVSSTVCGSQKGLMLPPGLGFNAISRKAPARTGARRSYWDWRPIL